LITSPKMPMIDPPSIAPGPPAHPSPTGEQFAAYQALVQYFNEQLFEGALPPVLLNFSRKGRRTRGFFAANRWEKAAATTHEISLNPQLLKERSPRETAATLVHELCHLWQFVFGSPSRASYHNREWAEKMETIGLMPSDTGEVGGKRTGQRMTHYVLPGGAFEQAYQAMPREYRLPWVSGEPSCPRRPSRPSKVCYMCPGCRTRVWGKPGLSLICTPCRRPFDPQESPSSEDHNEPRCP
jgi:predicted SprT family Zn-dependent metalloprotease